jgi:Recombination endonuclease VII
MRWDNIETHTITEANSEETQGICALCGPTRIHVSVVRGKKYWRCTEAQRERRRQWGKENPEVLEDQRLQKKYGITLDQYNQMLRDQNGLCARCEKPSDGMKIRLSVDHCHRTSVVRKLLCAPCNTYLGRLEANRDRLEQDLLYLDTGSFESVSINN